MIGSELYSGDQDGGVTLWFFDLSLGQFSEEIICFRGMKGVPSAIAPFPEEVCVSSADANAIYVFSKKSGKQKKQIICEGSNLTQFKLSGLSQDRILMLPDVATPSTFNFWDIKAG